MKTRALFCTVSLCISLGLISSDAYARDSRIRFPIADALNGNAAVGKINSRIRLYFAGQDTPAIRKTFGGGRTNKKTNALNKTDWRACEWVFLSAIIQMQARAEQLGANAVINIRSNYKNREFSSATQFECGAGNVIAGVALKGEFVITE